MSLNDHPDLMRVLRPKITPQAAARQYMNHMTGIAVTNATLGMLWWKSFFQVWTDAMFPEGRSKEAQ